LKQSLKSLTGQIAMPDLYLMFSHKLTEEQKKDAYNNLKCDHIIPLPPPLQKIWSNIPPDEDIAVIIKKFKVHLDASASREDYILIQGDLGMVFSLVDWCLRKGMIPIYSTTKRTAAETHKESSTIKLVHIFKHVMFRRYVR